MSNKGYKFSHIKLAICPIRSSSDLIFVIYQTEGYTGAWCMKGASNFFHLQMHFCFHSAAIKRTVILRLRIECCLNCLSDGLIAMVGNEITQFVVYFFHDSSLLSHL